ncbi:MAG: hypothetical protein LBS31_09345 [Candidatus Adiutrix sp.]|jgi:hypothetical protein|nr:hypothetical protein [Candidatus Adiutrix sp.]
MMAKLTLEEEAEIIRASLEASDAGDHDEEMRLLKMLPMAPHLVMAAKEIYGAEYVRNSDWDLSEANEEFGDGWLDR